MVSLITTLDSFKRDNEIFEKLRKEGGFFTVQELFGSESFCRCYSVIESIPNSQNLKVIELSSKENIKRMKEGDSLVSSIYNPIEEFGCVNLIKTFDPSLLKDNEEYQKESNRNKKHEKLKRHFVENQSTINEFITIWKTKNPGFATIYLILYFDSLEEIKYFIYHSSYFDHFDEQNVIYIHETIYL